MADTPMSPDIRARTIIDLIVDIQSCVIDPRTMTTSDDDYWLVALDRITIAAGTGDLGLVRQQIRHAWGVAERLDEESLTLARADLYDLDYIAAHGVDPDSRGEALRCGPAFGDAS